MDLTSFTLEKEIGSGAYGKVFRAIMKDTGDKVCVKVVNCSNPNVDPTTMTREVETWQRLKHPNCVQFIDSIVTPDIIYIIMELVDGCDLEKLIKKQKKKGPFEEEFLLKFFAQLASALHHCHSKSVIHRDVKPGNVLITQDNIPKLCDFGLSKVLSEFNPETASKLGTPMFASPELIAEKSYSYPTDTWSLGVLFYRMMTFEYPFNGATVQDLFFSIIHNDPEPFDDDLPYSDELKDLVFQMLDKDPDQRIKLEDILDLPFMPKIDTEA